MKESKKVILGVIKKHLEKNDKFESQVLNLALKKIDGAKDDGRGVYYSKGGKRLLMSAKTLEGDYTVKEGTQEIDPNAFWGCSFLRSVELPESIVKIGDEAFARCISLEKLNIPQSVAELGKNPFVGLDSEVVANSSASFVIESKVLYDAARTRLVACLTDAAMVIVPKTVQTIGSLAFSRRSKLKKVQLPEGLDRIGRDAFSDCDALEEIIIPSSVTTIDAYAFGGCENLKKVTFLNTVKHLSRTAFSDDYSLLSITVPEGSAAKFRKQLHIDSESDTLVFEMPAATTPAKGADKKEAAQEENTEPATEGKSEVKEDKTEKSDGKTKKDKRKK